MHRHVLPVADTVTLLVAHLIRASFGSGEALPQAGEPLHWRQLESGAIQVALHRDGRLSWSVPAEPVSRVSPTVADPASNPARGLLTGALAVIRDAGAQRAWPAQATSDSLVFRLRYLHGSVAQGGTIEPPKARFALPVFSLPVPWERPLAVVKMPRVHYPLTNQSRGVEGTVILRFIVDTAGRVEQGTIEEHWQSESPPPAGDLGRYYRDFVRQSSRGLESALFTPALVGGCMVSQKAEMPFVFGLRR